MDNIKQFYCQPLRESTSKTSTWSSTEIRDSGLEPVSEVAPELDEQDEKRMNRRGATCFWLRWKTRAGQV